MSVPGTVAGFAPTVAGFVAPSATVITTSVGAARRPLSAGDNDALSVIVLSASASVSATTAVEGTISQEDARRALLVVDDHSP